MHILSSLLIGLASGSGVFANPAPLSALDILQSKSITNHPIASLISKHSIASLPSLIPKPIATLIPKLHNYTTPHHNYTNPPHPSKKDAFRFNSTALPHVDFDIGHAYSGQIPVKRIPTNSTTRHLVANHGHHRNHTVVVDDEPKLFFIYVPSTNPNASEEIVIWINGGPGCSSIEGFWQENGPISWRSGTYGPVPNPFSWTNLTNMIWIDQPVGTGFATGNVTAESEADIARQFLGFWQNFVDIFELQKRKVYLTGESYAGKYIPYIGDAMLQKNDTKYFNLKGALMYSPYIGQDDASDVPLRAFVDYHHQLFPFSADVKSNISTISRECHYDTLLTEGLQFPPKGHFHLKPPSTNSSVTCALFNKVIVATLKLNPCFNIYQVTQTCPLLWDTLGFPASSPYLPPGYDEPYFNKTIVKKILHAPLDVDWNTCSKKPVFVNGTDKSLPSGANGGPLARVIERTGNVVIGHGVLDMVLLANSTLLALNNLTWSGAQGFSKGLDEKFYVPFQPNPDETTWTGGGEFGSWTSDRGLTFVEINLCGHMAPMFQPGAAYRTLEVLLHRVQNLSVHGPFSTETSEEAGWDVVENLLGTNNDSDTAIVKKYGRKLVGGKAVFGREDFMRPVKQRGW